MSLTAIPMHLVGEVAFGCYDTNEMLYARQRVPRIPDHSLTVFDNGFFAAEILCGLTRQGENRHFLIPARADACWEVVAGSEDDAIVKMRVSPPASRDELPRTEAIDAGHGIDAAQQNGRGGVPGNLGRAHCVQPDSVGNGRGRA